MWNLIAKLALACILLTAGRAGAVENPRSGEPTYVSLALFAAAPVAFKRGVTADPAQIRVYDGDSLAWKSKTVNVRIYGLDAPELAIKCEHDRGIAARDELRRLLAPGNKVLIRAAKNVKDKFGRTIAQVLSNGTDVATILIGKGLAHPYTGGARPPWPDC
jgi:endonuclease YncB( thermonuclease family)